MNDDEMTDEEINMYTRLFIKEYNYGPVFDLVPDPNAPPEPEDKDKGDYELIRQILESILYYYSYRYQDRKDAMISNMTQIAERTGDLNNRRLIAYCQVFRRILKEFNQILLNELEERQKK